MLTAFSSSATLSHTYQAVGASTPASQDKSERTQTHKTTQSMSVPASMPSDGLTSDGLEGKGLVRSDLAGASTSPLTNTQSIYADKVSLSGSAAGRADEGAAKFSYGNPEALAKNAKVENRQEQEQAKAEETKIQELKKRDQEVRLHEQAHAAVGGQYAGAPTYEYETGPDGRRYAVGGEVSIDVSEEEKPKDTIDKMQVVRAAALAPAEPSPQDYKVAAEATQKEQAARAQMGRDELSGQSSTEEIEAKGTNEPTITADEQSQNALDRSSASQYLQTYQDATAKDKSSFSAVA